MELLVVAAVLVILLLVGLPALKFEMFKARLTGTCSQLATQLQVVRFESLKHGAQVVVGLDLDTKRLTAFLDENQDRLLTTGERTLLEVSVPEAQGQVAVHFMGPDGVVGSTSDPAQAIVGLTTVAGRPVAIFKPDGSIEDAGAIRIGDGRLPKSNLFEVRISPRATARIEIRKFIHDDTGGFDPESGGSWYPRGGRKWKWY